MSCTPAAGNQLPADLNFTVYTGATFFQSITWENEDGTPVDLTGYTAAMQAKAGSVTLININTDNGGITLGGVDGTIELLISAEDTSVLPSANCKYDLLLTSSGGFVYPLLGGTLTIRQGVTS